MDAYRAQLMSHQLKGSLQYVTVSLDSWIGLATTDDEVKAEEQNMEPL